MRVIIISLFVTLISASLFSQAGMTVYAGPSVAFSSDKVVTGAGEAHYGYVVGAHARLNSDAMYFLFSGEYGTFDLVSNKKIGFIGGDDLKYGKFKVGMGFDVYRLSSKIALRSKIQGSILFVSDYNEALLKDPRYTVPGYTNINDGIAGLGTCLGVSLGSLIIDVEYEKGLFNLFKEKKTSKMNFLNLVVGFRF